MKNILIVLVALVVLANLVSAQVDQGGFLSATSVQTTVSNYYFAKPNELTIVVSVMGNVPRPGRYEISKSIDLVNLLALAGGATEVGTMGGIKVSRLVDEDQTGRRRDFELDLSDISRVNPTSLILRPGDIIQVTRSGWVTVRDVFTVVVSAAIITTAVAQVISLRNK